MTSYVDNSPNVDMLHTLPLLIVLMTDSFHKEYDQEWFICICMYVYIYDIILCYVMCIHSLYNVSQQVMRKSPHHDILYPRVSQLPSLLPSVAATKWDGGLCANYITMTPHERHDVSNNWQLDCLFNSLSTTNKIYHKCAFLVFCEGKSPMTGRFPLQRRSNVMTSSLKYLSGH